MSDQPAYTFILGSSSPRRRELLAGLGLNFSIRKPDIDETQHPGEAPLDYVRRLSQEKAAAIAAGSDGEGLVLSADTVVILTADTMGVTPGGEILGKPLDAAEARDMLRQLRGRTHQVCTAITLAVLGEKPRQITRLTQTEVLMRPYSDDEIEAYIATGDPFDKAGGYAIQHQGFHPVARIDGCYSNVMGLPVCTVRETLVEVGWPGIEPGAGCRCTAIASST